MLRGEIPLFPQAIAFRPEWHNTCSIIETIVVLPFVPVTEIIGLLQYFLKISISVNCGISLVADSFKIS